MENGFDIIQIIKTLAPAVLVFVIGAIAIAILVKGIKKGLVKTNIDPVLHKFILNACKIAVWAVLVVSVLKMLGVDTTSVVTIFAAAGAAIALALQGFLSNLASGIVVMLTKPFKKGDFITCAGNSGSVEEINLLHTSIITVDNQKINVPNSTLTGNAIINATQLDTRRVDIRIGVAYESDIERAKKAIIDLSAASGTFMSEPEAVVNVVEHADSAIVLEFRGWCATADYWKSYFHMQNGIKPALDAAGIEIPFTQIDLHTRA